VTTKGFRDVLQLGRFRAPRPYDLRFRKPDPLVFRQLRFEAVERMDADGSVVCAMNPVSLEAIARARKTRRVDALAICFINAIVGTSGAGRVRVRVSAASARRDRATTYGASSTDRQWGRPCRSSSSMAKHTRSI